MSDDTQTLPPLTEAHVMNVCRPGCRTLTCRYLAVDASGWCCEKLGSLKALIDVRVANKTMHARGDNCEGRAPLVKH